MPVSTPTLPQALSYYRLQQQIAADAVAAIRKLFLTGAPIEQVLGVIAAYQLASATASSQGVSAMATDSTAVTAAGVFAGVSSAGFPVSEPLIAVIDRIVEAPVEPVPTIWWPQEALPAILPAVERLVASEVQDAGRTASQTEFVARPDWTNYVRMLVGTSCDRCTVLAGRIYRDLDSFERHPQDDCVMVPVDSWEAAHDAGYVSSPQDAFDKGLVTGLSEDDAKAIADGADFAQVVNAKRGMTTADLFGRRVKATTAGTTKRAVWRKANPTRLVRLRPESIYRFAKDREDAIRLLRVYGYIT